jgi:hypothetical protein
MIEQVVGELKGKENILENYEETECCTVCRTRFGGG